MSVTAPRVARDGRRQWHDPETHRLVWISKDEYEQKMLEAGNLPNINRYDKLIENLSNDRDRAEADMLAARDPRLRDLAQSRMNQIQLAIDNAHEAKQIVSEVAQFGTSERRDFIVRLPPHLDDFANIFPKIKANHFRYVTSDPLEIAWLRRQVREQGIPGLREMEVGLHYALAKDGSGKGMWMPAEQYHQGLREGIFQP